MKLFVFLIVTLFVATTTAQANIPEDIKNIAYNIEMTVNGFAANFAGGIRSAVSNGLTVFQTWWNRYSSAKLLTYSIVSPALNTTVNNGLNSVRDAFANNNQTRRSIYAAVSNVYQQALQDYLAVRNTSSGVFQCWNISRPKIVRVISTYVNNTLIQAQPLITSYNQYVIQQNAILTSNFTTYQVRVMKCLKNLFVNAILQCRDEFVSRLESKKL
jgi:hypothetical protein